MSLVKIVSLPFVVLESFLSFYLNFYIVAFHILRLRNGVKLNPSSLLQLAMGANNISMRGMMLGCSIASLFPIYHVTRMYHAIVIMISFHLNFSYWLIAWLSAYYCTTITNIRLRIFIWMKRILMSFLPHLLFLSVVVAFILSIQSVWLIQVQISENNSTLGNILPDFKFSISDSNVILVRCLCSCLPFLVTLGFLGVTMSSLSRHMRKANVSEFAPPNLQAHVSAVRTMILFLVLSVLTNVTEIVKLMAMSFFSQFVEPIVLIMVITFALAEASIIIQSSRKLKKAFSTTFCAGRFMGGQN